MENKNTVIALALMLVVWLGFTFLFPHQRENLPAPPSEQNNTQTPEAIKPNRSAESEKALSPAVPPVAPAGASGVERTIVVENTLFRAVFTNIGARLESFELKKYLSSPGGGPAVNLVVPAPERYATLRTMGEQGFELPADAYYAAPAGDLIEVGDGQEHNLTFTTTLPSGLVVSKVYTFKGDSYAFNLQIQVSNRGNATQKGSIALALVQPLGAGDKGDRYDFVGASTLVGGKVEKDAIAKIGEQPKSYSQDLVWTGFGNKYFLAAIVPLEHSAEKAQIQKSDGSVLNILESPNRSLAVGEEAQFNYLLYFGPRELDIFKNVDHQLSEAIDFGFFSPIARPLLHVLKFFYNFLGNYGLAIILLTVIIKLLFWPLTQKSYTSMKNMQKLQPEMQKLRERFKSDRERLNREIMELYKKHRVNLLGGCLPMVIQIPVFFALYKVLLNSIELRHAPFYFWITDLSAKDPYYITPTYYGGHHVYSAKNDSQHHGSYPSQTFHADACCFYFYVS